MIDYISAIKSMQQAAGEGPDIAGAVNNYYAQKDAAMKREIGQMQIDKARKEMEYANGLKAYAQGQLATDTPNPVYGAYQDQLANIQGPVMPYQQFDGTANTGTAPESPTPEWTQAQAAYSQPAPAENLPKPSIFQLQRDYAMQQGNTDALEKLHSHALEQAGHVGKLTGNNELGVKLYNDMMGTDYVYGGTKGEWTVIKDAKTGASSAFNSKTFDPTNPQASFIQLAAGQDPEALLDKKGQIAADAQARLFEQQQLLADKRNAALLAGIREKETNKPINPKFAKEQEIKAGATATLDETMGIIDKLVAHPGREAGTGLSSTIDVRNYIPGTNAKDFRRELESFDGKLFLANVSKMKGLGALSDAEGKKLTAAAGAIKPDMSEAAFISNMAEIKAGLEKAKQRVESGGRVSAPQAPAGNNPAIPQQAIDFLKKNPSAAKQFEQKYGAGTAKQYIGR